MRILVIPDIHLKPFMFMRASEIAESVKADRIVCLMDIADDWGEQWNLELYSKTYDAAIEFAKKYPDTLWCYGNHDACYMFDKRETGYSRFASRLVVKKIHELQKSLREESQLAYVHRIDNVLFSHGGVAAEFVHEYCEGYEGKNIDTLLEMINQFGVNEMWRDISPIWFRPQNNPLRLYKDKEFLQVVGHTPVQDIYRLNNLISCDVFSTYSNYKPIGSQKFLLLNSETWEYTGI